MALIKEDLFEALKNANAGFNVKLTDKGISFEAIVGIGSAMSMPINVLIAFDKHDPNYICWLSFNSVDQSIGLRLRSKTLGGPV